ncbi:MAG: FHA domain-containing protein [Acidobacteria bacterium]|nr:FHA domain-containing protein [Acidobacteriota bacterium]
MPVYMECPHCHARNPQGDGDCRDCGRPLAVPSGATLLAGAPGLVTELLSAPRRASGYLESMATADAPEYRYDLLPQEIHLGRDPLQCQVVIPDEFVGRCHARIARDLAGFFVVIDLGSRNGTFVNGKRVDRPQRLRSGDLIQLGQCERARFRVHYHEAPAEASGERTKVPHAGTVIEQAIDHRLRQLQLVVDQYVVQTFDLLRGRKVSVGRDPESAVVLDHPAISGRHAEIAIGPDDQVVIQDLHSTNGTFVNGVRIERATLCEGDRLTFGQLRARSLIFRDSAAEEIPVSNEQVELTARKITLGRDPSNDIRLDHPVISKFHAVIEPRDGAAVVRDLGSSNGTFVNARRVTESPLEDNDRIRLGPYELRFSRGTIHSQLEHAAVQVDLVHLGKTVEGGARLLDDISLRIRRREFVGLIGPSGAGKSTLMDAVNGFRPATEGSVFYNGLDLYAARDSFRPMIGHVPQDDVLHAELSVFECLYYAARLRLPEDTSDVELRQRVLDAIRTVELEDRRETSIRSLSGGQRKRVSIAMELIARPSILFLDEPTSGLDPMTEERMMELFRRVANRGCTIVITTHLLGSFSLFDKVIVLVRGRLAFYGPGTEFFSYFDEQNPGEIYRQLSEDAAPDVWQKRFLASQQYARHCGEPLKRIRAGSTTGALPSAPEPPRSSALRQFLTLVSRYARLKLGSPQNAAMLFLPAMLIALLVKLMGGGANSPLALFMTVFAALWFGCSNAVREIVDETGPFRRERSSALKIPPYVLSKIAVLSAIALVQCLIFTALLRLTGTIDNHFWWTTTVMFLVAVNGVLLGLSLSAAVTTAERALMIFPLLLIPQLLLAGLIVPIGPIQAVMPIEIDDALGRRLKQQVGEALSKGVRGLSIEETSRSRISQFLLTPEPSPSVTALSMPMVARWGLEALAHPFVHDEFGAAAGSDAAPRPQYLLHNAIYLTLHSAEERSALWQRLRDGSPQSDLERGERNDLTYLLTLAGFTVLMTGLAMLLVYRRDRDRR